MTTNQLSENNGFYWQRLQKPAEIAENRLIEAILDDTFPPESHLPGERELAEMLGVTRPTLREALQRLARDGWVEINHGKPTRVQAYLKEGSLGVLNTLAKFPSHFPDSFIQNLLTVRLALAPTYTTLAVEKSPQAISKLLEIHPKPQDNPEVFAQFDWQVHHSLTLLSDNPVFVMILNGFKDLYLQLAPQYFSIPAAKNHSINFYQDLSDAASQQNPNQARILTDTVMRESLIFWQQLEVK